MTDIALLWQQGKLDARCRDCGAESAATRRCYRCFGRNLDYLPHQAGQRCLAWGSTSAPDPHNTAIAAASGTGSQS